MRRALLLGCTGMLAELPIRLAADNFQVAMVGRNRQKLQGVQSAAGALADRITLLVLDYQNRERLARWVAHVQLIEGPIDTVVAWIHGDQELVLATVVQEVERYRQSAWDLYLIQGIAGSLQPGPSPGVGDYGRFHQVILGYQVDGERSRWLTHEEIVQGTWQALQDGGATTVVGRVSPYSGRPQ